MTRSALPTKPKTALCYGDSAADEAPYEIEIGDEVEFGGDGQFGPATHTGEIMAIYPRKQAARVAYLDETDWKVNGDPKRKVSTVAVTDLVLIRRVM